MNKEFVEGKLIENESFLMNGNIYRGNLIDHDGLAIVCGDIVLGVTEEVLKLSKFLVDNHISPQNENACLIMGSKWDIKAIPYCIEAGHPQKSVIEAAINTFNLKISNIQFKKREASDADYIIFVAGDFNGSYIGKQGKAQKIWINRDPNKVSEGNVLHEMLHACSIEHEHSRKDRDTYITVVTANIIKELEDQFELISIANPIGSYDFDSIMHYAKGAGSANGKDTILVKSGKDYPNMGQRIAMTPSDIHGVNELYK